MENRTNQIILIKYGGNAMTDESIKYQLLKNIGLLREKGYQAVMVHGGGPFIKNILPEVQIESEFIDGHRKTTPEALKYVEMALKGEVNGNLVKTFNKLDIKAVGLSGKDGRMVTAEKRLHRKNVNGIIEEYDLGRVGDVAQVDTTLIRLLLNNGYIPVITCIASDAEGRDYNINADMFAGHVAGALSANRFIVLTDVDGLLMDKDDPGSLIKTMKVGEIQELIENKIIEGGMIPKIESCSIALQKGAQLAQIINGTKPDQLLESFNGSKPGTIIQI